MSPASAAAPCSMSPHRWRRPADPPAARHSSAGPRPPPTRASRSCGSCSCPNRRSTCRPEAGDHPGRMPADRARRRALREELAVSGLPGRHPPDERVARAGGDPRRERVPVLAPQPHDRALRKVPEVRADGPDLGREPGQLLRSPLWGRKRSICRGIPRGESRFFHFRRTRCRGAWMSRGPCPRPGRLSSWRARRAGRVAPGRPRTGSSGHLGNAGC